MNIGDRVGLNSESCPTKEIPWYQKMEILRKLTGWELGPAFGTIVGIDNGIAKVVQFGNKHSIILAPTIYLAKVEPVDASGVLLEKGDNVVALRAGRLVHARVLKIGDFAYSGFGYCLRVKLQSRDGKVFWSKNSKLRLKQEE